ncbi:MAG: NitT/TauT family transport system permease protein [Rhodospirillaceae bacterium]|jgi:ABC-type nitrate/sulfonate/bicarbonate transport system permease component|nr:NitT/TauT family transport system permease protein [Rhodospirillaceae bacterium]
MTDIGLPLGRPSGVDLAGLGRTAARVIAPPAVLALLLFGGWELLSRNGVLTPRLLPAPSKVFDTLIRSLSVLMEQAQPTFWGAVAGIVLAAALGIALGTTVSYSRTLMQAVYPTIVFFQLIPKVALAPVFLLWFGTGFAANVIFSVFIAFFPIVVATITGLQAAPPSYERLCRSLMMSRLKMFLTVKFPFALPHIFSGLRIGVTFAVIGVVLGEFITAQTGLGYIILFSANNFETALLLAAILLLCGVGIVLFAFFLALEAIVMRLYDSR